VAVQSVCFDFLFEEFDEDHPTEGQFVGEDKGPYPHFEGTTDFLEQAADVSRRPFDYDPEDDGTILGSLGTHEHWNNAIEKKYTRNMGGTEGIELFLITNTTSFTPMNSGLLSNKVIAIYVDSFDVKWFATDAGVSRLDGDLWSSLTTESTVPSGNGILSNNIRDMEYERTAYGHEIWLATDAGLSVAGFDIDGVTSATTYTTSNSDIMSDDILSIGVDFNHNRWAGTESGLSVFLGATWYDTTTFMDEDHGWHFFSDAIVGDMESYERDSQIFIATDSFGVLRYYHDVDGFTGASAMASVWSQMSKTINSITIRDTIQYYGTPVGAFVHHGNAAKSYWNRYTVDSGLISQNVTAAEIDGDGNIWFGTDKGLTIKRGNEWLNIREVNRPLT
jgi:ligand-binding sensor domain-containing protein